MVIFLELCDFLGLFML